MSRRRSTLSRNQKLTLLIAVIAIAATIVAAFISSHDWFAPPASATPNAPLSSPANAGITPLIPTLVPTATVDATLTAVFGGVSTANPRFIVQSRVVDGMEQVWAPEGFFVAGDIREIGDPNEKPFHRVYTDGFWINRTLITNGQYAQCPKSICIPPYKLDSHKRPSGYYDNPSYQNHPVINLTWYQASDYCRWRNGRLPTEAEFEKAAGWNPVTGETFIYPWGNSPPTDQLANYNGVDRDTTRVGSYPKGMSPVGAYDMAGNVWEWISDWYSETYYVDNQEWNNPVGPASGTDKVVRGASWYVTDTRWLRVSNRGWTPPDTVANEIGFRCVFEK